MYFLCKPVSDVRERHALREYVRERYGLGVMSQPGYNNLMFYKHNPSDVSSSSSLLFRVRSVPPHGSPPQQFVMLMTRMYGCARAGSILLLNRCIDAVHVVCGLYAPREHFEDTLVEGEIELMGGDGAFCFVASDILLMAGRRMQNTHNFMETRLPLLQRWLAEMQECHREIVGVGDFDEGRDGKTKRALSCPVRVMVPQWFESPQELYDHVFGESSSSPSPAVVSHVIVRRRTKCPGVGKDAMIPLIIASEPRDEAPRAPEVVEAAEAASAASAPRVMEAPAVAASRVVEEDDLVLQQFYVRGTSMPDVYELYRECASVGVRGPDATAGVRSMRDSRLLRDLISGHANRGGGGRALLPRCTFEFSEVIGRWTPHHA